MMNNIKPNVCLISGEKAYDPKLFHYRVERVMIDDHNVPSLEWVICHAVYSCFEELQCEVIGVYCVFHRDMLRFTASVREWMAADSRNIIAIHCKGGKGDTTFCVVHKTLCNMRWQIYLVFDAQGGSSKSGWDVFSAVTGRTGTMVCTWLIDIDQFESAQVPSKNKCKFVQNFKCMPFDFRLAFMFGRTVWTTSVKGARIKAWARNSRVSKLRLRSESCHVKPCVQAETVFTVRLGQMAAFL